MLLRYVAGYVSKFSDAWGNEWLDDRSSAFALARRILAEYQPLEPEMWLQLGAHLFPQVFAGGTMKRFVTRGSVRPNWPRYAPASEKSVLACGSAGIIVRIVSWRASFGTRPAQPLENCG